MKKFKEFLNEEMMPFAQTEKGFVGVDNGPVRDNINIHLASITAKPYATPYHAMEMVRKVLAPFSIFPPSTNFLDGDSGHEVFQIKQFGDKIGMTNDGQMAVKNFDDYYVYFEYAMNDKGSFDIFCEVVSEDELDEIMADIEDEMEEGDDTTIMTDAEDSFDDYKEKNQVNEETEQLDEISQKTATSAYGKANDPSYDHPKAGKILDHIKRKFGSKGVDDAESHAYALHFGRGTPRPGKDSLHGGLRQYASDKLTKSGKIPKNTQTAMKNRMDTKKWQGYGRKVGRPKGKLPG